MKRKSVSELVTHREVASLIGVSTTLLRKWVEQGFWPSPHAVVSRTLFFRRADVDHYVSKGHWPAR